MSEVSEAAGDDPGWSFGPVLPLGGGVLFRLFAPAMSRVQVALDEHAPDAGEPMPMRARDDGWHELAVESATPGTRYRFVLEDGLRVPDPASRYVPYGVHGPSEVVDPAFAWTDEAWRGRPWAEAVLYELHVGTFTAEGTFRAAIERLDHLRDLGVTGIELMCVCAFAGQRGWGYDGVQMYAPDPSYGRPEDLKAFVDAAHAHGLMVILDVVYNHFGPEGNYIAAYFPQIFSDQHMTAWGPGLNFDGPQSNEVRAFIVENAVYWTREFHMDGLRLDASHALIDTSPRHILNELADTVREAAGERKVHLILENEQRIARLLQRDAKGPVAYTAQWNHAIDRMLGLAMSGGCDVTDQGALRNTEELARALAEGFVSGGPECSPEDQFPVPPEAFVGFVQTHDLVGNRVFGERIHALASPAAVRAVAAVYLLLPQVPMLFMGEEWAASTPFPFFSDFGGELAEAVQRGRCEQLKKIPGIDEEALKQAPNPQAESTFLSAKLRWEELKDGNHASQRDWYQRVLATRRERIVPLLGGMAEQCGSFHVDGPGRFACEWTQRDGGRLRLEANLCVGPSGVPMRGGGEAIWTEGHVEADGTPCAWTVQWTLER